MASGKLRVFRAENKTQKEKKRPMARAIATSAIAASLSLISPSPARSAADAPGPRLRPTPSLRADGADSPVSSGADSVQLKNLPDTVSSTAAIKRVVFLLPEPGGHRCLSRLNEEDVAGWIDFSEVLGQIGLSKFPQHTERLKLTSPDGFGLRVLLPLGRKGFIIVADGPEISFWGIRTSQPTDGDCLFIEMPGGLVVITRSEIIHVVFNFQTRNATPYRWNKKKFFKENGIRSPKGLLYWTVSDSPYGSGLVVELPSGIHLLVSEKGLITFESEEQYTKYMGLDAERPFIDFK